jgi:hypothetical protein
MLAMMMMMRVMLPVVRLVFFNNNVQKDTAPAGNGAKLLGRQVHRLLGALRVLRHLALSSGFVSHGWPPSSQEERKSSSERRARSSSQFEQAH